MDAYHGAPYGKLLPTGNRKVSRTLMVTGDCYAYTCEAPTEMVDDPRAHTFFWTKQGKDKHGTGTSCIKSPITGKCGCENSNGQFMPESDDCV
ncbi:Small secreted protein [Teratosphaeria destructans]|uniref:Small secreted protein n=1 Tax=Teratosphaeria destructans TaxID=418781 RepID=A0A9W7W1N3_9PEZI|nr:Small secreted protein [Teratosphaeria destructans]